jgi:hypothetical protein
MPVPTLAAALACVSVFGQAPDALTWRVPPDGLERIKPHASVQLPRAATETDVWAGDYRLRQCDGRFVWRAPRGHALATRRGRTLMSHTRRPLRAFWWAS